ncbi:hypothetical protein GMLC_31450 [Geomonas limicola]|uniref:Uncharacterized protein n=1 Tax=Geomonas limicola TaxID=2740186 RepID=A0A6V8NAM9_9BACT|nr:hypothetical protein GMLC_31450 [Geomonas limicola]
MPLVQTLDNGWSGGLPEVRENPRRRRGGCGTRSQTAIDGGQPISLVNRSAEKQNRADELWYDLSVLSGNDVKLTGRRAQ